MTLNTDADKEVRLNPNKDQTLESESFEGQQCLSRGGPQKASTSKQPGRRKNQGRTLELQPMLGGTKLS